MRESFASIDRNVYITPSPQAVAKLMASHGSEACERRWYWIDPRTLGGLARTGRAVLGQPSGVKRARATTPLQEAVAMEAGFLLGSRAAGERAARMSANTLQYIEQERGITDMPRAAYDERRRRGELTRAADRGDPVAAAAIEATREFELAIGKVLTIALALVPEQPPTGRYRLPPPSPELAAALGECERAAVLKAFPTLAGPPFDPAPVPPQEPAPMTETANVSPKRLAPIDDDQIRRDHAATPKAADLAAQWGVCEGTVYSHLRRLGLTKPRGGARAPKPAPSPVEVAAPVQAPAHQTNIVPFAAHPVADGVASTDSHAPALVEETVTSLPAPPLQGYPIFRGRLTVEDLALAVALARREGFSPQDAIEWVRADVAEAAYSSGRA